MDKQFKTCWLLKDDIRGKESVFTSFTKAKESFNAIIAKGMDKYPYYSQPQEFTYIFHTDPFKEGVHVALLEYKKALEEEVVSEDLKAERIEALKAMHLIMQHMNNEEAYGDWICEGVPDEPQEDDFEYIAETDEEFFECEKVFEKILRYYIEDGLYFSRSR